jgi:hypothetical protein
MTAKELFDALNRATRGERVLYHTGLLMRDRQRDEVLNETAAAAWAEWLRGAGLLFQRRVSDRACDYYIVKVA